MRLRLTTAGCSVLLILCGTAAFHWNTLINPEARTRAYDQIDYGMTQPEVEALMGGPGEQQFIFVTGSMSHWQVVGFPATYRWEDAYMTADVTFQGPRGSLPIVTSRDRKWKNPPDLEGIWFGRITIHLFAGIGLGLTLCGLWPRKRPTA